MTCSPFSPVQQDEERFQLSSSCRTGWDLTSVSLQWLSASKLRAGPRCRSTSSTDGHTPQDLAPLAADPDANAIVGDLAVVLQALSQDLAISPNRIAVVGLGTGGRAALLAGSEALMSRELDTFGPRFAAHVAFYPGCTTLLNEGLAAPMPWSRAPVAAFLAGRHGQNASSACDTLVGTLAVRRWPLALWHEYPAATYAWDLGSATGNTAIQLANLGAGPVSLAPDDRGPTTPSVG